MKRTRMGIPSQLAVILLGGTCMAPAVQADVYLGGSVGTATVDFDDFDEDDSSWKAFGGYQFDLTVLELAIEGGYVDLGSPSSDLGTLETKAIDLFAVIGFDFSFIGIFGKAGVASWDADIDDGTTQYSEDGTDNAYGVGIEFDIASVGLRVEYEQFDIEDTDDVSMISVGVAWYF